jgi:hypothetical protein
MVRMTEQPEREKPREGQGSQREQPPAEPRPTERQLDEEIEESFPASDPPSTSVPVEHIGEPPEKR